jgi:hypothetical protein
MSATAPRIAQAAPDMRPIGVALGTLTLAVALVVTSAIARIDTSASTADAAPAPVVHDRGWLNATTSAAAPAVILHDRGWMDSSYAAVPDLTVNGFDKAHAANVSQSRDLRIETANGGLIYTGIPYAAPGEGTGGSNGTRFAK